MKTLEKPLGTHFNGHLSIDILCLACNCKLFNIQPRAFQAPTAFENHVLQGVDILKKKEALFKNTLFYEVFLNLNADSFGDVPQKQLYEETNRKNVTLWSGAH